MSSSPTDAAVHQMTTMMLVDGSNPEGVDPVPPLEWGMQDSSKFGDVVIYGFKLSPPVCKIRTHLAVAGIPYRCVLRQPNRQPKGQYQKVPSIQVNGRLVNDSYIIIKNLLPLLYNKNHHDEDGSSNSNSDPTNAPTTHIEMEHWEEKLTYGLQLAMEIEAMEDPDCQAPLLQLVGVPIPLANFVSSVLGWFLPIGGPGRMIPNMIRTKRTQKNDHYGPLHTTIEYLQDFKTTIVDHATTPRTSPVGCVDISVYATLKSFEALPIITKVIHEAQLEDWWKHMESCIPDISQDVFEKE